MNVTQSIINYKDKQVRIVVKDNEVWFVLSDVCKVLELRNSRSVKERLPKNSTDFCILKDRLNRNQKVTIINNEGLKVTIARSRSHKSIDFAKVIGLEVSNLSVCSKEQETLEIISKSFSHLKQIRQYYVNGFLVDLYFPEYKLAIECDEYNHRHIPCKVEKERERKIKNLTGCKFIRFNPDEPDFNIGDVINMIMMEVYKVSRCIV